MSNPTDTNQASEDELQKWWWFCNGTGTDACSKCRNSMMCSWHSARLDELSELIRTEKLKLLDALEAKAQEYVVIGEQLRGFPHFITVDNIKAERNKLKESSDD